MWMLSPIEKVQAKFGDLMSPNFQQLSYARGSHLPRLLFDSRFLANVLVLLHQIDSHSLLCRRAGTFLKKACRPFVHR